MNEIQKLKMRSKDKLDLHINMNFQIEDARYLLDRAAEESFEKDATISTVQILELNKFINGLSRKNSEAQDELWLVKIK